MRKAAESCEDTTVGKKTVPMFGCFGKIDLQKNK
jgi:hypothetical protein